MTITYPLTFPSGLYVNSLSILPRTAVSRTESSFSFAEKVYDWGGQGWGVEGSLPLMSRADAGAYQAFLLKLNGAKGTFLFPIFENTMQGVGGGVPVVNLAAQTGNSLNVKGLPLSTAGVYKAGDFFNLGTGPSTRLYMILNDVDSNGSGEASLTIWPDLRVSPTDEAPLVFTDCKLLCRMSGDTPYSIDINKLYSIQFRAFEAL